MICRICEKDTLELMIDFGMHPIVHNLMKTPDDAYKKYPFRLGCCNNCGFIQLMECIPPEILYGNYFTVSSWKSQPHVPRLISVMQSITGGDFQYSIFDIGCNDGSFLEALKETGYTNLYGIEPTLDASQIALGKSLNVHHGFFSYKSACNLYERKYFDIVTTRQVLEHIEDLNDFLKGIHSILKDDGILIIEIPDSEWHLDYFDYALWEEHVNYFTLDTLSRLLKKHSFNIVHHETTLFSGKALTVFCKKSKGISKDIEPPLSDRGKIEKYSKNWNLFKSGLRNFLDSIDKPIAMYGCGARSSTFINFTNISKLLDCFIDDQKEKQHLYVPGGNLKIEGWDEEKFNRHVFLLGVNTENEYKVMQKRNLAKGYFFSVLPPSIHLPEYWEKLIND